MCTYPKLSGPELVISLWKTVGFSRCYSQFGEMLGLLQRKVTENMGDGNGNIPSMWSLLLIKLRNGTVFLHLTANSGGFLIAMIDYRIYLFASLFKESQIQKHIGTFKQSQHVWSYFGEEWHQKNNISLLRIPPVIKHGNGQSPI